MKEDSADLGVLLNVAFGVLKTELHAHLAKAGYDDVGSSFGYVFRLLEHDALSLRELAGRLGMTPQGAHKVIEDMVAKDYVRRTPDPEDGRVTRLRLSARALAAMASARKFHAKFEAALAKRHGAGPMAALRAVLEGLASDAQDDGELAALRPF